MTAYAQLGLIAQPDVVVVNDEQIEEAANRLWRERNQLMAEQVISWVTGKKSGGTVQLQRDVAERLGLA